MEAGTRKHVDGQAELEASLPTWSAVFTFFVIPVFLSGTQALRRQVFLNSDFWGDGLFPGNYPVCRFGITGEAPPFGGA